MEGTEASEVSDIQNTSLFPVEGMWMLMKRTKSRMNEYRMFGTSCQVDGGAVDGGQGGLEEKQVLGNREFCFEQVRIERPVQC